VSWLYCRCRLLRQIKINQIKRLLLKDVSAIKPSSALAVFPLLPKATLPCKTGGPRHGHGVQEASSPPRAEASPCSSSSRDGQGVRTGDMAPTPPGRPSSSRMVTAPSREPGSPGLGRMFRGLHSASHRLWHTKARRDGTGQGKSRKKE